MQIESVGGTERPQPAREIDNPLVWLELDHLGQVRILDDQRRHRAFRNEKELGFGMAPV